MPFFRKKSSSNIPPLNVIRGTFIGNEYSRSLLREIGGGEKIREMLAKFYDKAFQDQHIDKFISAHGSHHGQRLGNWIVEKMGGEGDVWTTSRPRDARSNAHRDAWHSPKREPEKMGRRFKLDDCRVWMRLMFWSAREMKFDQDHPKFFQWYVSFIRHFIRVYEWAAQDYAVAEAKWSSNPRNIEVYINNGRIMNDVIGKI